MSETAKAPATNGTTKVRPEIRMKILEADDGKWTAEIMCATEKGTAEKSIICETYEHMVKSVPIILTQIKEKFYAR